jgi:MFS transporter, DHA1 family, tetracycline resistance protein
VTFLSSQDVPAAAVPLRKGALSVLFLVVFLDNLGFAIVVPYLYFYMHSLGGTDLQYGILLASYALLSFIFTPVVARISDRYGRRRILLIALAVSSLAYFLFGAANVLWLLFVSRMMSGATAATVPVAQAYVADVTTRENRLRYLGLLGAAAGIAFITGPAIGGTLSSLFGYAVPSFLASVLAFTNLISAYFLLPEPSRFRNPEKTVISLNALLEVLRKKQIALLFSVYFLFFVSFVFLQTALSPWLQAVFGFGSFETGLVFFFIGGVSVLTQAVVLPRLSKNHSRVTLAVYSVPIFTVGMLALALVQNLALLFAATAVIAFGFGTLYLTLNTLISLNAPTEAQGGTLGAAWAFAALAQAASPVLATAAFDFGASTGFSGLAFAVSAATAAVAFPLVWQFRKTIKE